jgi:hypothetical protein
MGLPVLSRRGYDRNALYLGQVAFKPVQIPMKIPDWPPPIWWHMTFKPPYKPLSPSAPMEGLPLHQPLNSIPPALHLPRPHPDQQTIMPPQHHQHPMECLTSLLLDTLLQPLPGSPLHQPKSLQLQSTRPPLQPEENTKPQKVWHLWET